jgi:hypothetical protein
MRREVIDHFGQPQEEYEDGRIWIYRPFEKYVSRPRGERRRESACETGGGPPILDIPIAYRHGILVLVFREDGTLERHSVVIAD